MQIWPQDQSQCHHKLVQPSRWPNETKPCVDLIVRLVRALVSRIYWKGLRNLRIEVVIMSGFFYTWYILHVIKCLRTWRITTAIQTRRQQCWSTKEATASLESRVASRYTIGTLPNWKNWTKVSTQAGRLTHNSKRALEMFQPPFYLPSN